MARRSNNKRGVSSKDNRGSSSGEEKRCKDRASPVDSKPRAGMNDVSWYTRYPELSVASASLPFPYKPGMQVPIGQLYANDGTLSKTMLTSGSFEIPGVMVFNWAPTVGRASVITDPVNIAAQELWTRVRRSFSGSLDVDPPDIMVYLLALDSVFSFIGWLKRVYRLSGTYSPLNYDYPGVVLSALGFDSTARKGLYVNRVLLWQHINELVHMSSKFVCPAGFDFMNRHYWMNDNIFSDSDSMMGQMFVMSEQYFYQFAEEAVVGGTALASALNLAAPNLSGGMNIVDDLYNFGVSLINALAAWDDAYTISGYLMRAFDGLPAFSVDLLLADELQSPIFSEEVLSQIENAVWPVSGTLDVGVRQNVDLNTIVCENSVSYDNQSDPNLLMYWTGSSMKPRISSRKDVVAAADVIIASRLMSFPASALIPIGTSGAKLIVNSGTEFLLSVTVHTGGGSELWNYATMVNSETFASVVPTLLSISAFDWHPIAYAVIADTSGDAISKAVCVPIGDVHNMTTFSNAQFSEINKVCLLSEFNAFSII